MALSKKITANGARGHHKFTLEVIETSTSDNNSYISYTFKISSLGGNYDFYNWGSKIKFSINIAGNSYSGTIPNYDGTSTVTLSSRSGIVIAHETDGTKTINISFSVTDNAGQTYTPGNANASGTFTLTQLHTPPNLIGVSTTELNSLLDNNYLYQYLSNKRFTIQAEAYDGESIAEYNIYIGSTRIGHSTSSNVIDVDFRAGLANMPITQYTLEGTVYGLLVFEVIDTIGATSRFNKAFTTMFYEKPNLISTSSYVKRNGQATGKVSLSLSGTFYNTNVGTKRPNTISLSFAYWATNSSESSTYYNIPSTAIQISYNNISINNWAMLKNNVLIEDVAKENAYYFKIKAVDSFSNTMEMQLLCTSGEWLMAKFKDRVDFKKITVKDVPILAPHVLYDGNTTTSFTLSDSAANYSYMTVFYRVYVGSSGLGGNCSISIPNPNDKKFEMEGDYDNGTYLYMCNASYTINDTNVTKDVELRWRLGTSGATRTVTTTSDSNIYIEKVVGYK